MSDPRLIDMEPGGENTPYESIREFTRTPPKQTGQLGGDTAHTKSEIDTSVGSASDSTADQNEDDVAQKLGMGASEPPKEDLDSDTPGNAATMKTRRQQGYGPGSGVGA
ncbi:uncharacterized protein N7459_008858 [Penicillium hispanicum]|uniref:uncharacterized protein n=1 Tax=Penicillium hispanicum TaxID=1080232 RepID=UPI00253FEEB7|nr:uncharacterized protein N7459_008858 [Penicillium hispanicum]KAJ5569428.1 hypothetical protein N7459_008858 [Penicillium hispanicum]